MLGIVLALVLFGAPVALMVFNICMALPEYRALSIALNLGLWLFMVLLQSLIKSADK